MHTPTFRAGLRSLPRIASCYPKTSAAAFVNARHFSSSLPVMVKKAYFDVEWEGPEVDVDANGKVTNKGASKGELLLVPC